MAGNTSNRTGLLTVKTGKWQLATLHSAPYLCISGGGRVRLLLESLVR